MVLGHLQHSARLVLPETARLELNQQSADSQRAIAADDQEIFCYTTSVAYLAVQASDRTNRIEEREENLYLLPRRTGCLVDETGRPIVPSDRPRHCNYRIGHPAPRCALHHAAVGGNALGYIDVEEPPDISNDPSDTRHLLSPRPRFIS
jgi:hypothetical protein